MNSPSAKEDELSVALPLKFQIDPAKSHNLIGQVFFYIH